MIYNVSYTKNGQRYESAATSFPELLNELNTLIKQGVKLSSVHMTFHVARTAVA